MTESVVTIVGRPNVGKSTVFNRLIGRRAAIVDDTPGVTRDRLIQFVKIEDRSFFLVDTGGLTAKEEGGGELAEKIRAQTIEAVQDASVVVVVVDGRQGLSPGDQVVADVVRKSGKPVILVVNKIDQPSMEDNVNDFFSLGLGDPVSVSAEHNLGFDHFRELVRDHLPPVTGERSAEGYPVITVLGRPNVGKSTLINTILKEERLVTSEIPGTTRDSIDVLVTVKGTQYLFIDTAGIRRRSRVKERLEFFSVRRAMGSMKRAGIVVAMVDGTEGLCGQDKKLLSLAVEMGKGVVLAVNKSDLIKEKTTPAEIQRTYRQALGEFRWVPVVVISAIQGKGLDGLFSTIKAVGANMTRTVSPRLVSELLKETVGRHHPPKGLKFPFGLQKDISPPTFLIFASKPAMVTAQYRRFLESAFREAFTLDGCPVKLFFKAKK